MKAAQVLTMGLVVLAATSAVAQVVTDPITRAQVQAETLRAARAGQLTPPSGWGPVNRNDWRPSTVARSAVRAEVLAARDAGELQPAGQGLEQSWVPSRSTLSRAEVKADVLEASRSGKLTPAGEGAVKHQLRAHARKSPGTILATGK